MIIDCISDLHGSYPKLEGGDLLIIAGDLTARDEPEQHHDFCEWLDIQPYSEKLIIAGNHDGNIDGDFINSLHNTYYLFDSGFQLVTNCHRLKVWGSPWTPTFFDWHFMKDRGEPIREKWDLIPDDTDILITHGPPYGILDQVKISSRGRGSAKFAGCEDLRITIEQRLKNLKLHVFGHVHEGYGETLWNGIKFVNASIMDENYNPVNKPIRIEL